MKRFAWLAGVAAVILAVMPVQAELKRSYVRTVYDGSGRAVMQITVDYLGKMPIGDFEYRHDWRRIDTDFYRDTRENLTDQPIEFLRTRSYSKHPVLFTTQRKRPDGTIEVITAGDTQQRNYREHPIHDGNVIPAFGVKTRENNYVFYTTHQSNVRYDDTTILWNGKEITFTVYYIYRR